MIRKETYWESKQAKHFPCPNGYVVDWCEGDSLAMSPDVYWNGELIGLSGLFQRLYTGDEAAGDCLLFILACAYSCWPNSRVATGLSTYHRIQQKIVTRVLGNVINELYMDNSESGDQAMRGKSQPYLDPQGLEKDFLKSLWKMSGKAAGSYKMEGGSGIVYSESETPGFKKVFIKNIHLKKFAHEFHLQNDPSKIQVEEEIDTRQRVEKELPRVTETLTTENKTYLKNTWEAIEKNSKNFIENRGIQLKASDAKNSKEIVTKEIGETDAYSEDEMAEIFFHVFRRGLRQKKNPIWHFLKPNRLEARILIFLLHDIAQYDAKVIPDILEELGYFTSMGKPFAYNSISSNASKVRMMLLKKLESQEKTKNSEDSDPQKPETDKDNDHGNDKR